MVATAITAVSTATVLLIQSMNFVGTFRETPLQRWSIFENYICIPQCLTAAIATERFVRASLKLQHDVLLAFQPQSSILSPQFSFLSPQSFAFLRLVKLCPEDE
ncbi:hypothetical protein H6G89_27300 [Oscillatoria sp. FACHB-1407]|uniref:hypothetical protein n=1 Tax=Oscillatoria sp. FACHB-1407 TaxID=2692847 RepID=UPI001686987F|nr:hypothetical protein [Oscillatoria sp. FACHB-1407]MBD2464715.1 hypothetical protein [Oscillatoria sp. FACHB-1407]